MSSQTIEINTNQNSLQQTNLLKKERTTIELVKSKLFRVVNLLFLVLLLVQLLPNKVEAAYTNYLVGLTLILQVIVVIALIVPNSESGRNLFIDIISFIYGFLIIWTLLTAKFDVLNAALFPPMGKVIWQFIDDFDKIVINLKSSLGIILQGYILGLVIAIPLGLFLGWSARLGSAATYVSKFLGSIPPIVYIPYGIALLPSFRSVSVFVIFLATFWPVLASTMSGVLNVEEKTINSARVLNLNKFSMLFSVLFPASLPQIFIGCNQGLSVSFILLTSAEMIGAGSGLGYYVKNYSDFGDYTRTIVGLLVIGLLVVTISFAFNKLQQYLLRWKK